jgi:hypothetical protein
MTFEEGRDHGSDSVNNFGVIAVGRDSKLAAQQKLGLWTERGNWIDSGHCPDPGTVESVLE